LHIDPQAQFYDRQVQPATREAALEHAGHFFSPVAHSESQDVSSNSPQNNEQGIGL
jgi:hypothetical protein